MVFLSCISCFILVVCHSFFIEISWDRAYKKYDIYSEQLPDSFDGFRIAFASDFHYESRFGKKRLPGLLKALQAADADLLLLGGDYRGRNGGNLSELFDVLYQVCVPYGTYGVMGNHENNANYEIVRQEMERTGIRLLEHQVDTLWKGNQYILLCGIRNPFDLTKTVFHLHCRFRQKIMSSC